MLFVCKLTYPHCAMYTGSTTHGISLTNVIAPVMWYSTSTSLICSQGMGMFSNSFITAWGMYFNALWNKQNIMYFKLRYSFNSVIAIALQRSALFSGSKRNLGLCKHMWLKFNNNIALLTLDKHVCHVWIFYCSCLRDLWWFSCNALGASSLSEHPQNQTSFSLHISLTEAAAICVLSPAAFPLTYSLGVLTVEVAVEMLVVVAAAVGEVGVVEGVQGPWGLALVPWGWAVHQGRKCKPWWDTNVISEILKHRSYSHAFMILDTA